MHAVQWTSIRSRKSNYKILNVLFRFDLTFKYVTILPSLSNQISFKSPNNLKLFDFVETARLMKRSNGIVARISTKNHPKKTYFTAIFSQFVTSSPVF